jgi:hypothetical protein
MKSFITCGVIGAAAIAASANAGFVGFVTSVRTVGGNTVIDIYAGVDNASDKFLNVYNANISTSLAGGFKQKLGLATKTWKPDTAGFTSTRNTFDDSFMTAGTFSGGAYGGEYYASSNTNGDPNFTSNCWNATPASPACTTVPANAGWYTGDPTSVDNYTESLAGMVGRVNTGITPASGNTAGSVGAAAANFGIWVGHIVVAGTGTMGTNILWSASVSIKDGVTGATDQRISTFTFTPPPPVDTDGDGIPNSADNCPNVPNPTQLDCNSNGIGDACETFTDCNSNGIPDSCDIASGARSDADSNGVPDSCQADCNLNNLPDRYEIATGLVSDLNSDGVPDTCQGAVMVDSTTDNLGSPSGADMRSHTFANLPYTESAVTLTLDAIGDLNNPSEWIDVRLNDGSPRRLFATDGNLCPATPDRGVITLTRSEFNDLLGSGNSLVVTLTCPINVDGTECKGAGLTQLRLQYVGIDPVSGDCNGNRRLDVVETNDGTTPDCNSNKLPDSCDIANGSSDCDLDGVPDSCELVTTPALDCNQNNLLDTCELAARGASIDCDQNGRIDSCQVAETTGIDCNGNLKPDTCDIAGGISTDIDSNGKPDECQTVQVPGQFATIQSAIDSAPTNEMRIVMVGAGIFPGPIDFKGKPVRVRGTSCAQSIISGNGGQQTSVVRFSGGEPAIAALECVTVRNGTSGTLREGSTFLVGGGIFGQNSAASVRNCFVVNNRSGFGGGAYFLNCTGEVTNCVFGGNTASSDGGGFQASQCNMTITDVLVENNNCKARGGGMHLAQGHLTLNRVTVRNNTSSSLIGGISWYAVGSSSAQLMLDTCTITGNTALVTEGGIGVAETAVLPVSLSLHDTTVCDNLPRPNITGRWWNLGGNFICDCTGDVDLDGMVNGSDLSAVLSNWGPCTGICRYDLNDDGIVNGGDLSKVLSNWGVCGD